MSHEAAVRQYIAQLSIKKVTPELTDPMKEMLLTAPDSQLDSSMFPLIEKWSEPVKAIEVLEVLDHCIFATLASGFIIVFLQGLLVATLHEEGKTLEEIVPLAHWRATHV